jgi:hypothetical protein
MIQRGRGGGGSGSSSSSNNNNNNDNNNNHSNYNSTIITLWVAYGPTTLGADFTPGLISIDSLFCPYAKAHL